VSDRVKSIRSQSITLTITGRSASSWDAGFARTGTFKELIGRSAAILCLVLCGRAFAAADEIQVYTDDSNKPGEHGLELHVNYARLARATADYPGEQPPARILRVTPEFSFGLAPHWDLGLYLPTSLNTASGSSFDDGTKLRLRWLNKSEQTKMFYGANIELAYSSLRVNPAHWRTELRLIAGIRTGDWLVAVNPIFSKLLSKTVDGTSGVDFELAVKANKQIHPGLALGLEHYADLGPINQLTLGARSGQATYLTIDTDQRGWDLNFGVGYGWNAPSDRLVFKMILGVPF
jgi:hypothetical protein